MKRGWVVACLLIVLVSVVSAGSFFEGSEWDRLLSGNAVSESDIISEEGSFAGITGNFVTSFLQLWGFATSTPKVKCNDKPFTLAVGVSKRVCGGEVLVKVVRIASAKGKTSRTVHLILNEKPVALAQGVMTTVKKVKNVGVLYVLTLPTKKEDTVQLQLLTAKPAKGQACGKKTDCQVGLQCTRNVCVALPKTQASTYTLGTVQAETTTTATIRTQEVREVTFTANKNVKNAKITVSTYTTKPASVPTVPEGLVFSYFEVKTISFTSADATKTSIKFAVTKKWLEDSQLAGSDVVLQVYRDGAWKTLQTSPAGRDKSQEYFVAATEGFSTFAITAQQPTDVSGDSLEDCQAIVPSITPRGGIDGPDFVITDVKFWDYIRNTQIEGPWQSRYFRVLVKYKNIGTKPTFSGVFVDVKNLSCNPFATSPAGYSRLSHVVRPINPGEELTESSQDFVCSDPGTYCLNLAVQPYRSTDDLDSGNNQYVTPFTVFPPICQAGWKCQSPDYRAYENEDCSLSSTTYCQYGCVNGDCMPAPTQYQCFGQWKCFNATSTMCQYANSNWDQKYSILNATECSGWSPPPPTTTCTAGWYCQGENGHVSRLSDCKTVSEELCPYGCRQVYGGFGKCNNDIACKGEFKCFNTTSKLCQEPSGYWNGSYSLNSTICGG